jgi:hypothetical protein
MGGKFKDKCNHCGKLGHKAVECRLRINNKPHDGNPRSGQNNNSKSGQSSNKDRKSMLWTYCNNKGHDVSECRKKKHEEGTPVIKELACLAMHLPKADHDIPKFGTCTGCGMWGPAFFHCGECGEESGMIFYPQQGNDNNIITQIPGESPDPEEDPEETLAMSSNQCTQRMRM